MKYEKEILEAFASLSKSPIGNQLEYINKVISAFIDEKKKYVVLNASTGAGKSIIGAVVAIVINKLQGTLDLASLILMHNNALTKQYYQTFSHFGAQRYIQLKGANNYKCKALSIDDKVDGDISAEHCAAQKFRNERMFDVLEQYCDKCEFAFLKKMKNVSQNVITNFSYYFVDRQFSNVFSERSIVIWDEAHTINDAFCEHNAIYFSIDRLKKCYEELSELLDLGEMDIFRNLKKVQNDLANKKITEENYMEYLRILMDVYKTSYAELQAIADNSGYDIQKYSKYSKAAKKYFNFGCKIGDLFTYGYEHIFEFVEKTMEVTVKPIFIGKMFEKALVMSDFTLFMSATISKDYVVETLDLDPSSVEFIKVPPTFPKEHKQFVFFDTQNLNYRSMQDPTTLNKLCANSVKIVKVHTEQFKESGIVLTPSFDMTSKIAEAIRQSGVKVEIYEHKRGEKSEYLIEQFKKSKGCAILLSPSIYEGVDLPGEISRYQIIVKAPFPSLAEKRMSYILKHHPNIYNLITIKKLVQGGGRSVRSMDDYAVTYVLDSNAQRIFNGSLNVWKDEFEISYMSAK